MREEKQLSYKGLEIYYKRKKIKSLRLRINPCAKLTLSVPFNLSLERVKDFLDKNLEEIKSRKKSVKVWDKQSIKLLGEEFAFLKQDCFKDLNFFPSFCEKELLDKHKLNLSKTTLFYTNLKEVKAFAKSLLEAKLVKMVAKYELLLGVKVARIRVKTMVSRWGSCKHKEGEISFALGLIHCDERLIEYVVCHELAHLLQPNHSKEFYKILKTHMSEYKKYEAILQNCGFALYFFSIIEQK